MCKGPGVGQIQLLDFSELGIIFMVALIFGGAAVTNDH